MRLVLWVDGEMNHTPKIASNVLSRLWSPLNDERRVCDV